jgi:hypothetical protein
MNLFPMSLNRWVVGSTPARCVLQYQRVTNGIKGRGGSVFQNELDGLCDRGIGELSGKGYREINTGSNTTAGDDVTVSDNASRVRDRTEEREEFAPGPMAGGAFSFKQAGCSEDQGPGADRRDVTSALSQRADRGKVSAVLDSLTENL